MGYAHEYAAAIMHRGRVPMEPASFVPDWADRPRKAKYYPGVETLPLPESTYPDDATVGVGCLPGSGASNQTHSGGTVGTSVAAHFTLPVLSGMLQDSYGLSGRRLGVQANTDLAALPHYTHANWSRGTASGGGLYPVSVYWLAGASGPLVPGVYYYSPLQHSLQRLLVGDVTGEVAAALGETSRTDRGDGPLVCDQYLVLGVKYWQNSFKYNSFSFHAVSMDVGALLQTWRIWAGARGMELAPALWFNEQRLSELLGVNAQEEGLFAVVPLRWATQPCTASDGLVRETRPQVRLKDQERSRTVINFDTLQRIHHATAACTADQPGPRALDTCVPHPLPAALDTIDLPAATMPAVSVRTALRTRRSSFGRFDASVPMTANQLATALAACAATRLGGEAEPDTAPGLSRLYAFVNHVTGVEAGVYAYEPQTHTLRLVSSEAPGSFLQQNYFLSNYNLEQAGVVVVPTLRTTAVLGAVGDRGYRLVNATVGAIAQTLYTTAAALDLGAGVALGFDNISFIEKLGLDGTDEAPLLIMLLGNERPRPADFLSEIA
ncbi:SagB family peptide dehydrogenase [Streptomyces sp. NPDC051098]|uniref:SagB family peptide dehydrogenase n=1 Tax=Streptomyces sp. NPDC051098 TaxID=3155411 RepID=UPI003446CE12